MKLLLRCDVTEPTVGISSEALEVNFGRQGFWQNSASTRKLHTIYHHRFVPIWAVSILRVSQWGEMASPQALAPIAVIGFSCKTSGRQRCTVSLMGQEAQLFDFNFGTHRGAFPSPLRAVIAMGSELQNCAHADSPLAPWTRRFTNGRERQVFFPRWRASNGLGPWEVSSRA